MKTNERIQLSSVKLTPYEVFEQKQRSMTDQALVELADTELSRLCKTGARSFTMCVPPMITDTDMVFSELIRRFKKTLPEAEKKEEQPIQIGTLNKPIGFVGCERAEIGHPVFEFQERYIVYLKNEKTGTEVPFRYYKEMLKSAINFQNNQ